MIHNLSKIIQTALDEDLGGLGDVTSIATIAADAEGSAQIIVKEDGIIAGGFVVEKVFYIVDPQIKVDIKMEDGAKVHKGDIAIAITGPLRGILTGERTALNFLCQLSGIATLTSRFVELTKHTAVKILDTRKTSPSLRLLEKYAVRMGGGRNHRIGLFDMVLIKENHIAAAGGIKNAVERSREYLAANGLDLKIEVETQTLDEVRQALALNIDRIMLDNMHIDMITQAVRLVDKKCELEISGGVNLQNIVEYANTGVDYISIGQLTHSAKALDFSLLVR